MKCEEDIAQGEFVLEYLGEVFFLLLVNIASAFFQVLTREEADRRDRSLYDRETSTFLIDLDFTDSPHKFAVDSSQKGNVARFLNHSVFSSRMRAILVLFI